MARPKPCHYRPLFVNVYQFAGGLDKVLSRMVNIEGITVVGLDESDIQRHAVVGRFLRAMRDTNDNKVNNSGS